MYLFLDTETGGLDPETSSLLEVFACVADEDLNIIETTSVFPKPQGNYYHISPEALRINKFVPPPSLDPSDGHSFRAFLQMYGERERLVPVGWNVHFDINFVQRYLVTKEYWRRYVSYRALDLQPVTQFLQANNKLEAFGLSLEATGRYFHVILNQSHRAKDDVMLCIEVMKKLKELL